MRALPAKRPKKTEEYDDEAIFKLLFIISVVIGVGITTWNVIFSGIASHDGFYGMVFGPLVDFLVNWFLISVIIAVLLAGLFFITWAGDFFTTHTTLDSYLPPDPSKHDFWGYRDDRDCKDDWPAISDRFPPA